MGKDKPIDGFIENSQGDEPEKLGEPTIRVRASQQDR